MTTLSIALGLNCVLGNERLESVSLRLSSRTTKDKSTCFLMRMDSWSLNHLFVGKGFDFNQIVSYTWKRTDKNNKHNHMLKMTSSFSLSMVAPFPGES